MQGRVGWWLMTVRVAKSRVWQQETRSMVVKPPTRSAVHGIRLPVSETVNEEVEAELKKRKEEKEKKRKEVEKTVDSLLNRADEPVSPSK